MYNKILICGLPGSGKTTLARRLAGAFKAIHINADFVRSTISKDLGFSPEDRLEQARRMSAICSIVNNSGHVAIADFVCPTEETREAFGVNHKDCFVIWMNTDIDCRYDDTKKMFVAPSKVDYEVKDWNYSVLAIADAIIEKKRDEQFDTVKPTALFVGRYQPLHDGHKKLIREGINRAGQAIVAVRDTFGLPKNPFTYEQIYDMFADQMKEEIEAGKLLVIKVPNITNIFYGRDVGYTIEKIDLDAETENISATKIREEMGIK